MIAESEIRQLARLYGVQRSFIDNEGHRVRASRESIWAVLRALGAPEDPADVADAVHATEVRRRSTPLPAVLVAWDGELVLELRVPPGRGNSRVPVAFRLTPRDAERGDPHAWETVLSEAPTTGRARVVHRAAALAPGYYDLTAEVAGARATSMVVAAPRRVSTPRGRCWGGFLPLYSLRSERSWGVGDLGAFERLGKWLGDLGGSFLGTTPLLAAFLDEPCDYSPYTPVSRLMWNELFVDVTAAPGFSSCEEAVRIVSLPEFQSELAALDEAGQVDYRIAMACKRRVLSALSREERSGRLESFLEHRPQVVDYATFRAIAERRREPWTQWPARLGDGRVDPSELRSDDLDPAVQRYHSYVQWLAEEQMSGMSERLRGAGVDLYLDLPLGVHPDGFDAWHEQRTFARGVTVGAPPDGFFTGGQDWGIQPVRPDRLRESGYRHFIDVLRHHLRHARVLRVDHVMSLHRLYWIPDGMPATAGVYVRYPAEELYAVVALEAARAGATIVGENLGTVPPAVGAGLRRHGLLGMYVAQFRMHDDAGEAVEPPRPEVVASLNTHDTPTFAAFWHGLDIPDRVELGLLDAPRASAEQSGREKLRQAVVEFLMDRGWLAQPSTDDAEAVLRALLRCLADSPARMLVVNLEDTWLEERPQNVPGTSHERPNWLRKVRFLLEEVQRDPRVRATLESASRCGRKDPEQ